MLFAVMGYFKSGADTEPTRFQIDWNEHLGQANQNIRLAGPLRDKAGERVGYMAVVETDTFEAAEAFLRRSPYFEAGLYERSEIEELDLEVGRLN